MRFARTLEMLLAELPEGFTGQVIIDIGEHQCKVRPHAAPLVIKRKEIEIAKPHRVA